LREVSFSRDWLRVSEHLRRAALYMASAGDDKLMTSILYSHTFPLWDRDVRRVRRMIAEVLEHMEQAPHLQHSTHAKSAAYHLRHADELLRSL